MKPSLLAVAAVAAVALGACGRDAGTGAATDGRSVYQALCASCHGEAGRPPPAMVARLGVRDLTAPELRARVTPELVEHQVRAGSKNKLMPSFAGVVEDAQIRAVSAYVASPRFPAQP